MMQGYVYVYFQLVINQLAPKVTLGVFENGADGGNFRIWL